MPAQVSTQPHNLSLATEAHFLPSFSCLEKEICLSTCSQGDFRHFFSSSIPDSFSA